MSATRFVQSMMMMMMMMMMIFIPSNRYGNLQSLHVEKKPKHNCSHSDLCWPHKEINAFDSGKLFRIHARATAAMKAGTTITNAHR